MCPHCDHPLDGSDRGLCGPCWSAVVPRSGGSCPRCGFPTDADEPPCVACHHSPPPQQATAVWGEYDGVLRTAVLALKHAGRDDLAAPLGERLGASVAVQSWSHEIDVVTFVPSHPSRRLRKPWAASELLAQTVSRRLGKPAAPLLRRHGLGRQTGRTRARRLALSPGSFSARSAAGGKSVLIVDDVTTTGTTLARASTALLRAGAEAVFCAACAFAPDSRRF